MIGRIPSFPRLAKLSSRLRGTGAFAHLFASFEIHAFLPGYGASQFSLLLHPT